MDEPTTHDDDTDHVVAQLRRYADAAERTVPPIPTIDTTNARHRSLRRWLAAAAVVALLGGALATYAVTRGDDAALQTVDEPPAETSIDLEDACPAPRADGPRVEDLRVLLPVVRGAEAESTVDGGGDTVATWIEFGDSDVRAMVWGAPTTPDTLDGGEPTTVEICDPFSGSATRTEVPAAWHRDEDDRLRLEVVLTGGPGLHWSVTATTALSGSATDDELTSARAELRRLVAGMSWPAPAGATAPECVEPNAELAIDDEPSGGHRATVVPEGYEPGPVEIVDTPTPGLEVEVDRRHVLPLRRPDGAGIDVVVISSYDPVGVIEAEASDAPTESIEVPRCAGSEDDGQTGPITALRSLTDDRILVGAREWEWGGWMVIGTGGATNEEVLSVVQGLRGGALG